jgi:hypothetical protein
VPTRRRIDPFSDEWRDLLADRFEREVEGLLRRVRRTGALAAEWERCDQEGRFHSYRVIVIEHDGEIASYWTQDMFLWDLLPRWQHAAAMRQALTDYLSNCS